MPRAFLGTGLREDPKFPEVSFRPMVGVMLDFDLWSIGLLGRESTERFPMDVADFSLLTLGFSGTGRGIFDSHGISGLGGATLVIVVAMEALVVLDDDDDKDEVDCINEACGPAKTPSATL